MLYRWASEISSVPDIAGGEVTWKSNPGADDGIGARHSSPPVSGSRARMKLPSMPTAPPSSAVTEPGADQSGASVATSARVRSVSSPL